MKTTQSAIIRDAVIKNLLSAHERIAERGDEKSLIFLSRYLLRLAKKDGDVIVNILPEDNEQRSGNPVNNLK